MQDNFELSNAEGLDESISSAMGLEEQSNFCCGANGYYYNTNGEGAGAGAGAGAGTGTGGAAPKLDPEKIKQGVQLAAGILSGIQSKRSTGEADIDAICGKKPLFGKEKKARYQKCVEDAQKRKIEAPLKAQELELESKRLQAQMEQTRLEQQRLAGSGSGSGDTDTDKDKKFLGMPKAVGITVAVVGGLALIVGGIFLVRKMRK
jgi:hypothetical protein